MDGTKIADLPAAGAITGSELVPIVQGGDTVRSTVDGIKNGAVKVYRALLSQSGTDAPVARILENSLGGVPVWTRSSVGQYQATLAGAFPLNKTYASSTADWFNGSTAFNIPGVNAPDVLNLSCFDGGFIITDIGDNSFLEILVYP